MERQFGASNVEIDSIEGWVRFAVPRSQDFDFNHMRDVFEGANYELFTVELVVNAKLQSGGGSATVVVEGSGQEFPFEGAEAWTGIQRIHAMVVGWRQFQPKLVWVKPTTFSGQ